MPLTIIARFEKDGHRAEIAERTVTMFAAFDLLVFVDGSLIESQLFHGARVIEYTEALQARIRQFTEGGWLHVYEVK